MSPCGLSVKENNLALPLAKASSPDPPPWGEKRHWCPQPNLTPFFFLSFFLNLPPVHTTARSDPPLRQHVYNASCLPPPRRLFESNTCRVIFHLAFAFKSVSLLSIVLSVFYGAYNRILSSLGLVKLRRLGTPPPHRRNPSLCSQIYSKPCSLLSIQTPDS